MWTPNTVFPEGVPPGPYETAVGQLRRPDEGDVIASLLSVFAQLPEHTKKGLHDKREYRSWYKYGYGPRKVWTNGVIALAHGASRIAWARFAEATAEQAKVSEVAVRHAAETAEPYSRYMHTKKLLQILWGAPPVAEGGPPPQMVLPPADPDGPKRGVPAGHQRERDPKRASVHPNPHAAGRLPHFRRLCGGTRTEPKALDTSELRPARSLPDRPDRRHEQELQDHDPHPDPGQRMGGAVGEGPRRGLNAPAARCKWAVLQPRRRQPENRQGAAGPTPRTPSGFCTAELRQDSSALRVRRDRRANKSIGQRPRERAGQCAHSARPAPGEDNPRAEHVTELGAKPPQGGV